MDVWTYLEKSPVKMQVSFGQCVDDGQLHVGSLWKSSDSWQKRLEKVVDPNPVNRAIIRNCSFINQKNQ